MQRIKSDFLLINKPQIFPIFKEAKKDKKDIRDATEQPFFNILALQVNFISGERTFRVVLEKIGKNMFFFVKL